MEKSTVFNNKLLPYFLLFPQLVYALFDKKVNLVGSCAGFAVSLVLRLGGGEPLFGIPPLIPYPQVVSLVIPLDAPRWYDAQTGALLFPYKTVAACAGIILIPLVSRLTAGVMPARPLSTPETVTAAK